MHGIAQLFLGCEGFGHSCGDGRCADKVADCDFTQPPDEVFATCASLINRPRLRQFRGGATGTNTSAWHLNQTTGENGPFVLFIAPQMGGDFSGWACSFVFSYLATQGIATFVATIPDPADANRDNWNRVPSSGGQPVTERDTAFPCCSAAIRPKTDAFACGAAVPVLVRAAGSGGSRLR